MYYLLLFSFVLVYFFVIRLKENKLIHFAICYFPIFILLVLTLGLQENVGTDYFSYLDLVQDSFRAESIKNSGETLFYFLLIISKAFKNPQLIFVFSAVIQMFFLMLIILNLKKKGYELYKIMFFYFTLSLLFFNTFNGIRQYIAVYIVIYALIKLGDDNKKFFFLLIILASFFHKSAIIFLIFLILRPILNKNIRLKVMIPIAIIVSIISIIDLSSLLDRILLYFHRYSTYVGSEYLQALSFQSTITKIPKIIIVYFSIYSLKKNNYKYDNFLLNLSFIAILIMNLSFTSGLIWRIYQYFDFFIIFPVYDYFKESKNWYKYVIVLILIIMLIIKIILFPTGEYSYNSILF